MNEIPLPLRVVELLCSRICHDLVSPVAAISNGVELLNEMGASGMDDAIGLLELSARQASVRLQLFRLSYGAGGSEALISGKMIYETFKNFIESDRVTLSWDLMNDVPDEDLPAGFFKVLLNAMMFARECITKGGTITVKKDMNALMVIAEGPAVILRDGMREAFDQALPIDQLSAKTVHAYVTGAFARGFDCPVTIIHEDNKLTLSISYVIQATEEQAA